jgi:CP family cyanate transporter-like MFS transporter
VGIVVVALVLRSPIIAVSPLLATIQADTGLSSTVMGLLATLPIICFGAMANVGAQLARRFGIDLMVVALTIALGVGIVIRSAPSLPALFIGTIVLGSAIAMGNVLMPALVKRDFPHHVSLMTSFYVMGISAGGALGAGLTVPIQHRFGLDWRGALAIWVVPVLIAIVMLFPRVAMNRTLHEPRANSVARPRLWGERLAWQVSLFMGLQSFLFFAVSSWTPTMLIDGGMSEQRAGAMLSLMNIIGLFASFMAPILAQRGPDQRWLVAAVLGIWGVAIGGLVIAPTAWTPLWMICFGIAAGAALSVALSLIVLRAPDTAHAAALSGMAQGVGYLLASTGPFLLGALHDAFGGWRIPMATAFLVLIPTLIAGLGAGRNRLVGQRAGQSPADKHAEGQLA